VATTTVGPAPSGPIRVERRVPTDGIVMVTRQRVRVGRTHAGKLVTVLVEDTHLRVLHNGEELSLHPRLDNRPVTRFRAYQTGTATTDHVNHLPRTTCPACRETSHNPLQLGNYVSADSMAERVRVRRLTDVLFTAK
jgi:hypothetical protein